MTKQFSVEDGKIEEGKIWPQYLAVLTALISIFTSGLHFGWPSPSIPKILSDEFPLNVSVEEASYIAIIGPAGDILGSIVYPGIVDLIGRKYTILLIALPQIISLLMISFSTYNVLLLYFARFIGGMAEAACFTILPLYIGEVAEPRVRGVLGSCFSFLLIFGILTINLVGPYFTVQSCALNFLVLPVIFVLGFMWMPESPYYLLMKAKYEKAEKSLQFLRGKKYVNQELEQLTKDVNRQMAEPGTYKELFFRKANRKSCVIMFGIRMAQQFSGVSAFTLYMQTLFEKSTDAIPKHLASSLIFGILLLTNLVSVLVIDKVGRKPLLLFSCGGCLTVLVAQATFYLIQDYTTIDLSDYTYLLIVGLVIFIIFFGIGLGNVVNLMLGELFSSNIKAKASCLSNIVFALTMIISTKFFQYTAYKYSLAVPFYIFAFCQVCGLIFLIMCVPETTGKTLEEIQQDLAKKKTPKAN